MRTLSQLVELSLKTTKQKTFSVNFNIKIKDELWKVHEASVAHRDILLYCDKGTATFLVDSYGDNHIATLFDWECTQ